MLRSAAVLFVVALGLPLARGACSPAENKCGDMCCCVTCKCLENPYSCEDMWGKPTDPVGYVHDERWVDPAWIENHHREQMAIAEEHRQQHMERMREMEANMSPEQKERRERMARRRMDRRSKRGRKGDMDDMDMFEDEDWEDDVEHEMRKHMDDLPGMGEDADADGDGDVGKMRRRMEKRMQDAMKKHRRRARDEEDADEPPRRYKKGWVEDDAASDPRAAEREL
mmetsp:Transcript_58350/g.160175  ORF Transcript_58350/g.160175 Transcript_58350/m.160175 type:complete len:226 (+) Transcript_58350:22-699(+)